jgi:hypothetical protein
LKKSVEFKERLIARSEEENSRIDRGGSRTLDSVLTERRRRLRVEEKKGRAGRRGI